jgi:hypothetical protein
VQGDNSHLTAMADIWDLGDHIYSVGDGAIMLGDWLLTFTPFMWLALILKKLQD